MNIIRSYLKFTLVILSTALIAAQNNNTYQCDVYRCSLFSMNSNQCIYSHAFNSSVANSSLAYDISLTCASGTYCPATYSNSNVTCTSTPTPKYLVDGEACTNNTNCASNICNNNLCSGIQTLGVCTVNSQCKIGSYCGKLTEDSLVSNCVEQKVQGQPCTTDLDCKNNMGCYSGNATCLPYFSLADGSLASLSDTILCKNMKVYNNTCVSTVLQQSGDECLANNGTLQTKCQYSYSSTPNATYSTDCQCSKAYTNRQFCEYDTQNPNWQKLINAMNEYFNHEAINKHTSRRMDFNYNLKRLSASVGEYPQYKDADDCAINIDIAASYARYSIFLVLGLLLALFA